MASSFTRHVCAKHCQRVGSVVCIGCQRCFCKEHLSEHRQELNNEMYLLTEQHNDLQEDLIKDDMTLPQLTARINTWERETIQIIQERAENLRRVLHRHFDETKRRLNGSLKRVSEEFQINHIADDFTEFDLKKWSNSLKRLRNKLEKLCAVGIKYADENFDGSIRLIQPKYFDSNAPHRIVTGQSRWSERGVTVAGNGASGDALSQLHAPYGLDMIDDQTFIVTEFGNHRIMLWTTENTHGEVLAAGTDHLNKPAAVLVDRVRGDFIVSEEGNSVVKRWSLEHNNLVGKVILSNILSLGLAMDDEGYLYVSDFRRHEVRRYGEGDREGVVVAGGYGQGAGLHQLNGPRSILVDRDRCLYIADSLNERVMRWSQNATEGIVVAGSRGCGNALAQLNYPNGILVDATGSIYVADQVNNRIVRWLPGAREGQIIVGSHDGRPENSPLKQPTTLAFDQRGNLYVTEFSNHRVQRFDILTDER